MVIGLLLSALLSFGASKPYVESYSNVIPNMRFDVYVQNSFTSSIDNSMALEVFDDGTTQLADTSDFGESFDILDDSYLNFQVTEYMVPSSNTVGYIFMSRGTTYTYGQKRIYSYVRFFILSEKVNINGIEVYNEYGDTLFQNPTTAQTILYSNTFSGSVTTDGLNWCGIYNTSFGYPEDSENVTYVTGFNEFDYYNFHSYLFGFEGVEDDPFDEISFRYRLGYAYLNGDTAQSWNNGYQVGLTQGYDNGYHQGSLDGYSKGYADAVEYLTDHDSSFMSLFGAIADTPIRMLYGLFNFDLLGVSVLTIVLTCLTAVVLFGIVKRFIK